MNKCLLFDSDGTLVDSELLNNQALAAELYESGISETAQNLVKAYRGWMFSAVLDDIQLRHDRVLDSGFTNRFRHRASVHFESNLRAIANIPEVLAELNAPMCVASNAPLAKINQAMQITGLATFFGDAIYSAYEINSWKPEPGLFLHAAKEMGYLPEQCVVIEDSDVGVTAALAAGIEVIRYDPEAKVPAKAGVINIKTMADLPVILEQIS